MLFTLYCGRDQSKIISLWNNNFINIAKLTIISRQVIHSNVTIGCRMVREDYWAYVCVNDMFILKFL